METSKSNKKGSTLFFFLMATQFLSTSTFVVYYKLNALIQGRRRSNDHMRVCNIIALVHIRLLSNDTMAGIHSRFLFQDRLKYLKILIRLYDWFITS